MKKRVAILGAMTALIAAAPAGAKASTLDGWWRFDDSSATVAQDSSQNNNDATVSGGATHAPGYRVGDELQRQLPGRRSGQ